MDIYKLYRNFWNFTFENPEKVKPNDISIFSFAIEHCNRLGWKDKFGFPTSMAMEATGIKSYSVFKKHLMNLIEWGFIIMVEHSRNQHSSNIIALEENYKADYKALDKALSKHTPKHLQSTCESTYESTDSIDIPIYNLTNNNFTTSQINKLNDFFLEMDSEKIDEALNYLQAFEKKKVAPKKKSVEREIIMPFDSEDFKINWEEWKAYRKAEHKFNYTSPQSEQASLTELTNKAKGVEEIAIKIIHQSMASGWKGLFELKTENNGKGFNNNKQSNGFNPESAFAKIDGMFNGRG